MRARLLAVVSATALALLGVEATLRLVAPQSLSGAWLTTSPHGYAINRPSTTAAHVIPGRAVRYRINSFGLRGDEPPAVGTRVLVVGDSVTFGWLLDEPDTFVARLAEQAAAEWGPAQVSFLNAAVGGWGTADYTAFVEDRAEQLRPQAVLVFMGGDDVLRTGRSSLWTRTDDGRVSRQHRVVTRPAIYRVADFPGYRFVIEHSHAAQFVRQAVIAAMFRGSTTPSPAGSEQPASLALAEALLVRLAEWCRSRGVALLVSNGTLMEFVAEAVPTPNRQLLELAPQLFERLSVPYLSVARAHGPLSEPLQSLEIPGDGHPNERGAALIKETVWPWLREHLRPIVERPRR